MKIPEEESESLNSAQEDTQRRFLAFLDELTELTKRYNIVISSEGNIDVPSLRVVDPTIAASHRYVPFWDVQFSYPLDFIFVEQTQHLIDMG